MSENRVMRFALERAGLAPRLQSVDARYGERSAIEFIDPSRMSDKQIIDEITVHRTEAGDISRQLDDDKEDGLTRGEVWRAGAKRARRAKLLRVDQLTEEAIKRGLLAAVSNVALTSKQAAAKVLAETERAARRAAHEARESQAQERREAHQAFIKAKEDAKAERMRLNNMRNRAQCEMFVKAAYHLHSRDVCDRIWKRAREMFAGDPAWKEKLWTE